jgi:DMSO/TMAO reductase YedYZ molybdopterin-dependent catalytic subunit
MNKFLAFSLLFLLLSACTAASPSPTPTTAVTITVTTQSTSTTPATLTATLPPAATSTLTATLPPTSTPTLLVVEQPAQAPCNPQPIVAPTRPPITPQTNRLDETTGLHMTGVVQELDLATYRLKVSGKVDHPLSLTLDQLRCLPKVTASPLLACGDLFRDIVSWSGVPIQEVMKLAGIQAGAKTIIMTGADGYIATLTLEDALKPQNYLAYEWEGQPVPILHGFPLRAVFPDFGGWAWVKWLVGIEIK